MQAGNATLEVPCPNCKKVLLIPSQYAGQTGKCNACGGVVQVPTFQPLEESSPKAELVAPTQANVMVVSTMPSLKTGPFGLWMGMPLADIDWDIDEIRPGRYRCHTVPKPHSSFESYILQITPRCGLAWIKAIGKTVNTSVYGYELQSEFAAMEKRLSGVYGKGEKTDILLYGSIWNEPRDWMQSLLNKERILMTSWPGKRAPDLPNQLKSVGLVVTALSSDSGYIAVEYSFTNEERSDAEITAAEDDAL